MLSPYLISKCSRDRFYMMTAPATNSSVWVGDKVVWIKLSGRASFNSSVDFKTLINSLWQKGYCCFVLDLTDCLLMDSTFLGVLAGLGLKFSSSRNNGNNATIELLNPNARISDLLDNLGVSHLFRAATGARSVPENLAALDTAPTHADRKEISKTCLEAHQTLMKINPDNVAKFKDVAQFLAEDLKKME